MDLKDIKAIIDLMKKNSISEFEMERQDFKIKLKRTNGHSLEEGQPAQVYMPAQGGAQGGAQAVRPAVPAARPTVAAATTETEIKSPMVGTMYRAPSPEAANYV